jgi:hypothetical protein
MRGDSHKDYLWGRMAGRTTFSVPQNSPNSIAFFRGATVGPQRGRHISTIFGRVAITRNRAAMLGRSWLNKCDRRCSKPDISLPEVIAGATVDFILSLVRFPDAAKALFGIRRLLLR